MKKYWLLPVIGGILAAIICMSQYADFTKHRYEERAKHSKAAPVTKSTDGKTDDTAENHYQPPVWAKFVAWPEGVGAWAVILTLLAIAWQSIETRESSKASLLNVQALINIERPRIIVYVESNPIEERAWNIWAKNVGKTPAMLIGLESDMAVAKNESELPETPEYREKSTIKNPIVLLPEKPYQLHQIGTIEIFNVMGLTEDQKNGIVNREQHFFKLGKVTYKDLLDSPEAKPHETFWCSAYIYSSLKPDFVLSGPPGYNRHT